MTRKAHSATGRIDSPVTGLRELHTGQGVVERIEAKISEGWAGSSRPGAGGADETTAAGGPGEASGAVNVFGRRPLGPGTELDRDGRGGSLSSPGFAAGLARAGIRAAGLVEVDASGHAGSDLADLAIAARHRLPLVVHVKGGSATRPLDHAPGLFQLVSASPQEAADLTLIAHRLAELALVPGLHLLGGAGVAETLTSVEVPDDETLRAYLGDPDDDVKSPTPAQAMLFGRQRRRLPDWFSLDHPGLQGADRASWERALEEAASGPFFLEHVQELAERAMNEFRERTGRAHAPVRGSGLEDADQVVVAAGPAAAVVEAVATQLRRQGRARIGVLRITLLAPFPRAQVIRHLAGKRAVCVLEGGAESLTGPGPLTTAVETVFGASPSTAFGRAVDRSAGVNQGPPVITARFGDAISPRHVADLLGFLTGRSGTGDAGTGRSTRDVAGSGGPDRCVFLGTRFPQTQGEILPKREILAQRVERDYPELTMRTLAESGPEAVPHLHPEGGFSVLIRAPLPRPFGPAIEGECVAFLEALLGRPTWGRPVEPQCERSAAYRIGLGPRDASEHDRELVLGANRDQVLIAAGLDALPRPSALATICDEGILILLAAGSAPEISAALPRPVREAIQRKRLQVHILGPSSPPRDINLGTKNEKNETRGSSESTPSKINLGRDHGTSGSAESGPSGTNLGSNFGPNCGTSGSAESKAKEIDPGADHANYRTPGSAESGRFEINLGAVLKAAMLAGLARPEGPGRAELHENPTGWNEDRVFARLADAGRVDAEEAAFIREAADRLTVCPWEEIMAAAAPDIPGAADVPLAVRRIQDGGPPFTRLSRYWSETAPDYLADPPVQPAADPFRAVDFLPPATATFSDRTAGRVRVPNFLPDRCTGCGQCLAWCPHSALDGVVIGPEPLLQAGLEMAGESGAPLTELMPAVRPLAQFLARRLKKAKHEPPEPSTAEAWLPPVFEAWAEQKKLTADKLDRARDEFERIQSALGSLPLAVTDTLFLTPEAQHKGSGELFSLVVDPLTCTGCMACVTACPERALEPTPETPRQKEQLHARFRTWEHLPDTRAETVQRLAMDPSYGPVAAHLLSRSFGLTLAGADAAAPGSGERLAMRWIASTVESLVQPHVRQLATEVADLVDRLGEQVRGLFGNALPVGDLDGIVRGLARDADQPLHLDDLVDRLGEAARTRPVDAGRLKRLVELIGSLRELTWVLTEGPSGLGRARIGLVAAGAGLAFGRTSPLNPFSFPVLALDSEQDVDVAAGVCQGHLRHMLDNLRLVRRARLEAAGRYDPRQHDAEIAALNVADLSEEEWGAVPPLLLVGDERIVRGRGRDALAALLDSDIPVKVILVARAGAGSTASGPLDPGALLDPLFFALAHRRAFVLAASLARPAHLADGLAAALRRRGPAFLQVYAPAAAGEGGQVDGPRVDAGLALLSRLTPCLRYDPDQEGVFGVRLSLEGNPAPEDALAPRTSLLLNGDEPESDSEATTSDTLVTLADWAWGQPRFAHHFSEWTTEIGGLPLADYLGLAPAERAGQTPFLERTDPEGRVVRHRVSSALVRAAERTLEAWRVLQEWAGLASPFVDVLKRRLRGELEHEHQAALEAQKTRYEEQIRTLAETHRADTVARLRDRLVQLSGYGAAPDTTGPTVEEGADNPA